MNIRKVISERLDWNLTADEKRTITIMFGALAGIAMLVYSYPNTVKFFRLFIFISQYEVINIIVCIVLAAFFNTLEIISVYLVVWKITSDILIAGLTVLILVVCGGFSTIGTFGSLENADAIVQTEQENAELEKNTVKNVQKSIDEKSNLLSANNEQIARMEYQGLNVPTKIYDRSLMLSSELDSLNLVLTNLTNRTLETNKKTKKRIMAPEKKRLFNYIFAPTIEILMLICTFFSILFYKEVPTPDEIVIEEAVCGGYVVNGVHYQSLPSSVQVAIARSRKTDAAVGFQFVQNPNQNIEPGLTQNPNQNPNQNVKRSDNIDSETRKTLLNLIHKTGKSDPIILHLFDTGYTNLSLIGRMAGQFINRNKISDTYVRRVLVENRNYQPKKK